MSPFQGLGWVDIAPAIIMSSLRDLLLVLPRSLVLWKVPYEVMQGARQSVLWFNLIYAPRCAWGYWCVYWRTEKVLAYVAAARKAAVHGLGLYIFASLYFSFSTIGRLNRMFFRAWRELVAVKGN